MRGRINRRAVPGDFDVESLGKDVESALGTLFAAYTNRYWPSTAETGYCTLSIGAFLARAMTGPDQADSPTEIQIEMPFGAEDDPIYLSIDLEDLVDGVFQMHRERRGYDIADPAVILDPDARAAIVDIAAAFRAMADRLDAALEAPG